MPLRFDAEGQRTGNKKAMQSVKDMADMASRACWRNWYRTGVPEITLGSWGLVAGLIAFFWAGYPAYAAVCVALLFVSVLMLAIIPASMHKRFVIPSGMLLAPNNIAKPPKALSVVSYLTLAVVGIMALFSFGPSVFLIGVLCAAGFIAAYSYSGRYQYFVLAIASIAAFGAAPYIAGWLELEGVGVVAVGLLVESAVVMPEGEHTFMNALADVVGPISGDIPEGEDEDDIAPGRPTPQGLSEALSAPDVETRYLAAAYLSNHLESNLMSDYEEEDRRPSQRSSENLEPMLLKDVLHACFDEDPAVASMARRALTGIWGPDPDEEFQMELARQHGGIFSRMKQIDTSQLQEMERRRREIDNDSRHRELKVEKALRDQIGPDAQALSELLRLANEPDEANPEVRYIAAEMLGSTHSHLAYATLASLITASFGDRELVRSASEGFRGAQAVASVHLEPLLEDSREWVRVAALDACLELVDGLDETDAADAALARALLHDSVFKAAAHEKPVTRAMSLCLLSRFGDEALPKLVESCRDRYALVRGEGVRALSIADSRAAIEYVLTALQDRRAFVRSTALACAAYLRLSAARPIIAKMIDDPDKTVSALAKRLIVLTETW